MTHRTRSRLPRLSDVHRLAFVQGAESASDEDGKRRAAVRYGEMFGARLQRNEIVLLVNRAVAILDFAVEHEYLLIADMLMID